MKKIFYTLLILTISCFTTPIHAMKRKKVLLKNIEENQIQEALWLPKEIIARIAGYCQPYEKNILMKLCKDFYECLKDRELIMHANPLTVSVSDKIKSIFHYTSLGDATKLAILLNQNKAIHLNVDCTNSLGMTPFHIASDNKDKNIMQLLRDHGAKINKRKPESHALHEAAYKGDKEVIKTLLELNVNPDLIVDHNLTPLCIASRENHPKIVRLLISKGAKVNTRLCRCRCAPLYLASQYGHTKTVQLLIQAKANVNYMYKNGVYSTPLLIASANGHIEIVKLLLNAKANINRKSSEGKTPLQIAQENEYAEIVELLQEKLDRNK